MTTDAEFSALLAQNLADFKAGAITQSQLATAIEGELGDWAGTPFTKAAIAAQIAAAMNAWSANIDQTRDWWAGTPTGGWNAAGTVLGGGYYPLTDSDGTTVYKPCPAYMLSVTAKGDPGHDAKQDLAMSFPGPYANGELLGKFIAAYPMTFVAANSRADAVAPSGSQAVVTINKKTGGVTTVFGTITFATSQTTGAVAFTSGATATVAAGDVLSFVAPNPANSTFADLTAILAGN